MEKVSKDSNRRTIWDELRKKYVALTPEESIRQQFISYLIHTKSYSPTLMANEVTINVNGLSRRCDTVVYNQHLQPRMIIEYKRSDVEITEKVFNQIFRYNIPLKVEWLTISNGRELFCCRINYETMMPEFLNDLPSWEEINREM